MEKTMKLRPDIDILTFFDAIRHCKGDVFFKTNEGDILNLNSALSRFIFITIMETRNFLTNGNIECTELDDMSILSEYVLPV